jgi:hypothetical protein
MTNCANASVWVKSLMCIGFDRPESDVFSQRFGGDS